jgi:hypothetical protein
MSVVMPAIDWPAPSSGEPPRGLRSVAEVYSGSALIELASVEVSSFHAASEGRSKNGTCAATELAMMPTDEKCDDAPVE